MKTNSTPKSSAKPIFVAALRLTDLQARQEYLEEACGENMELRRDVEDLLAAHGQESAGFPDKAVERFQPAQTRSADTADEEPIDVASHPIIGPYKLLEQIGEGGMGTVFMAQQSTPIKRKVALKIIKPGMDSQDVIARFEAERQALALMDHPNIAQVLDAGTTDDGRPFFVMELVKGVQLTEYCARSKLSTDNRLRLFVDICHGIQHAHQKGVIHRDLKPGNLLVTLHDGKPVVKIIDFGIAKAINQELTERTLFTQYSQLIGTPLYMSPEQAELSGLDVDTRSDVYSLGVLLYELLTGTTPFDRERLRQAGFDEMRRIIREEEPPVPSLRLSTLAATQSSSLSQHHGTDLWRLTRVVRGELDWIAMKAMEKDRTRRYESAGMLADDIQRYLAGEAVEAYPPTFVYRFSKFATRHKTVLMTAALVAIALILGTIASLWQARQADQARRLAEDKSIQLEEQRDLARENESFARQLVYAGDVRLAAQAWEGGDVRHYADLLDRHVQSASSEDLRGFEWRYLRQLGTANLHTIAEGAKGVCSVRHSPDGKFLAAGRHDGTIHVWDGRSGRQLATLSGHVELVRGIDFSPDNKRLVSIGYGGVIRIWELESFREIRSIKAFENVNGYRVCFAMDGQSVIAIAEKSPAKLWDVDSGELIDSFGANGRGSWGLAVSPDGQSCVVRENQYDFRIWDLSPRKHVAWMRFPLDDESAYCLRYSPDGAFIAAGTDEKLVRLYEARTGKMIASFAGHDDQIWDVAFHPNGTMLASCDFGGVIRTWHLGNEAETSDTNEMENWPASFRGHAARAWSVDFSPDGKRLVSASKDGTVLAWTGRERPRRELELTNSLASDFSPSGDELFIARRHTIARWNRQTNEVLPFGDSFQKGVFSLTVSPDGTTIATGHGDGTIRLWNRKTEQVDRLLRGHEDSVDQIAFSPDGKLMVSASWDGTAKLWDVAKGQRHGVDVPPHCVSAAFSPDGQTFAISSEDDAMLYDATSGKRLHLLQGHQNSARCVAFSPDGRWLATGSSDRTVRIWDVQSGTARYVIAAHRDEIYSLAFSPDGRTIASGDERGTVAFSHVETGRFLFDTQATNGEISSLSFSPDGETLAATCFDKHVVLLHAPRLPNLGR